MFRFFTPLRFVQNDKEIRLVILRSDSDEESMFRIL